jgi:predicted dehydrogenase/aryl-alcohol dehydrogenase-like predicted oxidoreductase
MSDKLRWGILSTGSIAGVFAKAVAESKRGQLVAVASRSQESADRFGEAHGIQQRYSSYDALLVDPGVQAVYISTPHPMHAQWAVRAANAGKHILCEKPLALNFPEAMAVVEAARRNDVFLMEAFMYRCHPQTAKLVELIRSGVIGQVRVIHSTFSFQAGYDPKSRLYDNALAGGGIMDVGCYSVSMARLIAGAAIGQKFSDPIAVKGEGKLAETGVDEYAAAVLKFPGEIVAQVSCGVGVQQDSVVRVYGTEGSIFVPSPWFCAPPLGSPNIVVSRNGEEPREVIVESESGLFSIEADTVAASIGNRQAPSPAMTWDDTLGNMKTLDAWRMQVGVTYASERTEVDYPTIDRQPLSVRSDTKMQYGEVPGVGKPISRLVLGTVIDGWSFQTPHGFVLFDEFFANGGTCFDTAYIYNGGDSERTLGRWIKNRGVRDQVVVLGKGAHTPFCDPDSLTEQLHESLERLQTDKIDLYMMHRDNTDVPVGEFVDVLNQHQKAGRIGAFGGSNWTIERIEAANKYARANGLNGFAAISNHFSLARCLEPVWAGCLSSTDTESCEWFARTNTPLFSWSSTAKGFFAWGDPSNAFDSLVERCWYSEDNFQRLARAKELAVKKGVSPVTVALAYVLNRPFPTWALFGPRTLEEMRKSLGVFDVSLTEQEMAWLNLEE